MVCPMLDSGMRALMKIFVPFLVLLAVVGCRTGEYRPGQAMIAGVNGTVESWNGRDWVAGRGEQVISDGHRVRTDAGTTADLSSTDSLTLRASGANWMETGPCSAQPGKREVATRTVLEVERGCVLISVGEMPLNSEFEIRGGEVFAQVQGAECTVSEDGTVAQVTGQVCVAAERELRCCGSALVLIRGKGATRLWRRASGSGEIRFLPTSAGWSGHGAGCMKPRAFRGAGLLPWFCGG